MSTSVRDEANTAHFLGKGSAKGLWRLPEGRSGRRFRCVICHRGRSHAQYRQALTGLGSGVIELALRHRGDAYRVVYALQIGPDIWVVHAFQKKSKAGIKTPVVEIDLVRERLKRLKEKLS